MCFCAVHFRGLYGSRTQNTHCSKKFPQLPMSDLGSRDIWGETDPEVPRRPRILHPVELYYLLWQGVGAGSGAHDWPHVRHHRPAGCYRSQTLSELTTAQLQARVRMLEGNVRALTTESNRLDHEKKVHEARLKENHEKIKLNKQLPYLISNVVEVRRCPTVCGVAWRYFTSRFHHIPLLCASSRSGYAVVLPIQILDVPEEDEDSSDWAAMEDTTIRSSKAVVVKTSTRQVGEPVAPNPSVDRAVLCGRPRITHPIYRWWCFGCNRRCTCLSSGWCLPTS